MIQNTTRERDGKRIEADRHNLPDNVISNIDLHFVAKIPRNFSFKFVLFRIDIQNARLVREEQNTRLSRHLALFDDTSVLDNRLAAVEERLPVTYSS